MMRHAFAIFIFSASLAQAGQIVPEDFRGAKQPQVAVSSQGLIAVAFGRSNSVYFTRSDDDAKSFSRPVLVSPSAKLALGMRRGPRIVATEKEIAITAVSEGNLLCWNSTDKGNTWSKSVRVNDADKSGREGLHAMAVGGGKLFSAWLDLRNNQTEIWGAISTDGGKTWQKNRLIYHSPDGHICECCHPSVIFAPDGKITAMWRNWLNQSRDLYWATSEDGGNSFGPAAKLGSGTWPLQGCPMDGGGLAIGADGLVSIWRRQGMILSARNTSSEKIIAANGAQPVVAAGEQGLYYIWQEGKNLMAVAGASEPFVLAKNAAYPSVASASVKSVPVAVWEANSTIFGQRLAR